MKQKIAIIGTGNVGSALQKGCTRAGYEGGHFALEDHCAEIGSLTRGFLEQVMPA